MTYDDGYKAEETVRLVKEVLVKDAPLAFIGVLGTANNEAIIKDGVLARANVPLVGAISGASTMLGAPNIFVTKASYADEVRRLFEILSLIGINRVAVVYQDDGFGKDIVSGAERAAPATRRQPGGEGALRAQHHEREAGGRGVLKSDPQIIYLGAVTSAAVEFIKQYRKAGGTAQVYGVSVIDINGMKKGLTPRALGLRLRRAVAAHHVAHVAADARVSAARQRGERPRPRPSARWRATSPPRCWCTGCARRARAPRRSPRRWAA